MFHFIAFRRRQGPSSRLSCS